VKPPYITDQFLKSFITNALAEDIGDGDHSSLSSIREDAVSRARLLVKDSGILAGVDLAIKIFRQVDPRLQVNVLLH